MSYELAIVGAGNMAEAITRGIISRGVVDASQIIAADVSPQRRELFTRQFGITTVLSNAEAARQARTLLLSVKPQQMAPALAGIGQVMDPATLVISIAAGIHTRFIEQHLGGGTPWRVVRSMPNTPMLIGEGMVAICGGSYATVDDLSAARRLFQAAATVIEVAEEQIDAVTALSGSGPAYLFYVIEHMIQAGMDMGLSAEQARTLAIQTAVGSARLLAASSDSPQQLRQKVTSPGGTTEAAIDYLQAGRWGQVLIEAIRAAERRGRELS